MTVSASDCEASGIRATSVILYTGLPRTCATCSRPHIVIKKLEVATLSNPVIGLVVCLSTISLHAQRTYDTMRLERSLREIVIVVVPEQGPYIALVVDLNSLLLLRLEMRAGLEHEPVDGSEY